jgi:hypothetical protein
MLRSTIIQFQSINLNQSKSNPNHGMRIKKETKKESRQPNTEWVWLTALNYIMCG